MHSLKVAVVCLVVTAVSFAQNSIIAGTKEPSSRLPVTRVILYKNGVGYFEHAGHVRDSQDVHVDFTTAQLNDVLKSLTVLDLGKGRITGVSYNSTAPLEKQLGSLLPVGENPTTAQFLDALRGARVEVRNGSASAAGRLLSIEEREVLHGNASSDGDADAKSNVKIGLTQVSLVSDTGEVRLFDLTPSTTVRVIEKDVNDEVGKYLGLVASTRDQDVRRMTISTAGEGERSILISYISEVPVWKSTYRIVVPKEGKPLLQGWAVVDNTVGEDWDNVQLSLVAGAPQSFVQELSQPYYTRRPVVGLPQNAMLSPQTHEATIEQFAQLQESPKVSEENGAPPPASGPSAGNALGGPIHGNGFDRLENFATLGRATRSGIGAGAGGGVGVGKGSGAGGGSTKRWLNENVAYAISADDLEAGTTVGQSQDLGDLFEYKLSDRVTIRKNQSALVPILQTRIDAEKVSVWNPNESSVLRALWIDNTSKLTFDGGSFNVLEGDAFAGEGLMDPIKPGEKRLLSYAADLGILINSKERPDNQRVSKIAIAHGVMTQTTQERSERTYTARNRDSVPRVLVIEHPARAGWKLASDETPVESTASYRRFKMTIEPQKTATLVVKEYQPLFNRYMLTDVNDDEIKMFLDQKMINPDVEKSLRGITKQKNEIVLMNGIIEDRKAQVNTIGLDQQRLRENMKALKGSAEEKALIERYVKELNEQEDKVQALRREIADWEQKRDSAQNKLNESIESLTMEATL